MGRDTLPDRSKRISDGKSSVVPPGRFLDSTKLNGDVSVHR